MPAKAKMTNQTGYKQKLGRKGEKLARRFLKKLGYRHLVDNYTLKQGEIDLIMTDEQTIVFVEVKTRENENFVSAEDSVNYGKRKRISSAARHFIQKHHLHEHPCRFDMVVVTTAEGKTEIRHHKNAFTYH